MEKYDPSTIEPKWQKVWEKEKIYQPDLDKADKPFFNLMMFPYPSAEGLHVGNMYAFTGADIYGRFKRMQGYDLFEPIGLDGFGIHSENYAIKVGHHPRQQAKISEQKFYRQLRVTGNAYDWSRTVETYDPDYYKWTQWIFIQLFKAGLAYRKKSPVNFCPVDKTVLADEQVIDARPPATSAAGDVGRGRCERCGALVEKRDLEQWFFKITAYADRLLDGLSQIDWTEKVKIAQRNWIGKSEGMEIEFPILPTNKITVYTIFPETIYGVTYMVLAPEHGLVDALTTDEHREEVKKYVREAKHKSILDRTAVKKVKTGVFTGSYCINPVNNEKVPIWVADYVLMGYGTGAVMGVPGSDHRDFAFAKKYGLPIVRVIGKTRDDVSLLDSEEEVLEEGVLVNSEQFSALKTPNPAREKIKDFLDEQAFGKRKNQYHLRDWLISRQRYWGAPIPMIFCEKCDWQPVPEKDLPVLLPDVKDWKPKGIHSTSSGQAVKSPLASVESFVKTTCPNCGGKAVRETDVSDTFLDSSWYFLRYLATEYKDIPFPSKAFARGPVAGFPPASAPSASSVRAVGNPSTRTTPRSVDRVGWLPVSMYIGGAEHSVLHLLYTRFLTMVLHDLGFVDFDEPFPKFFAHGLLIKERAKMSKSRGNIVVPDSYIKKYGADTLRTYLMFLGPFSHGGDFYDSSIGGVHRFLSRVWRLILENSASQNVRQSETSDLHKVKRFLNKTIKKVTEDMEALRFNTAIAGLMELLNTFKKYPGVVTKEHVESFLLMLAPLAPHLAEELWQKLARGPVGLYPRPMSSVDKLPAGTRRGSPSPATPRFDSIHVQSWPTYDPKLLEQEEVTIVVTVDGKVRDQVKMKKEKVKMKNDIENIAKATERVKRHLEGKTVRKVVYVEGKIINFVTR